MALVVSGAGANCLNMYSQWLELASSSLVQCEWTVRVDSSYRSSLLGVCFLLMRVAIWPAHGCVPAALFLIVCPISYSVPLSTSCHRVRLVLLSSCSLKIFKNLLQKLLGLCISVHSKRIRTRPIRSASCRFTWMQRWCFWKHSALQRWPYWPGANSSQGLG